MKRTSSKLALIGNPRIRTHGNGGEAFVVFGNPIDFQMALER